MSVRVFISWSGSQSKVVAEALRRVLPDAMQHVSVWMSANDIQAGERWGSNLNQQLNESQIGILCLTRNNVTSPWLLFEAGSLAKSVDSSRVLPLLIDLNPDQVPSPLTQFQSVPISHEGFQRLLASINSHTGSPLTDDRIARISEQWWPFLEREIKSAKHSPTSAKGPPSDQQRFEEVLSILRRMSSDPVQSATWSHGAIVGYLSLAQQFHERRRAELLATHDEIVARGSKPSGMYEDYAAESEYLIEKLKLAIECFAVTKRGDA